MVGNYNPGIKIVYDRQKKDLKEETEYDIRENGIYL